MVQGLLVGLEEDVTIENLDTYLQQEGVIVQVHIGRIRGAFELTPKTMGVNIHTDSVKDFFKSHVKNGSMSFLPNSVEKGFQRIENRIRQKRVRMSIGYENSFMPIDTYKDFAEDVKQAKVEYLKMRDEVLETWVDMKKQFVANLDVALHELNSFDRERIYNAIISKYPSKDAYRESFYLHTSLKAFPVMANLSLLDEGLSDEVREGAVRDNLKMVHEVLGVAFNDAFQTANTIYKAYAVKRKLPSKTKGSISHTIKGLKSKNVLKHPAVDDLIDDLDSLYHATDVDDGMEMSEAIMAKSYGNCSELNLMNYLDLSDSELGQSDLEVLAESYAQLA